MERRGQLTSTLRGPKCFQGLYDVIDVGIKYRFIDLGMIQLGAGVNSALFLKAQYGHTYLKSKNAVDYEGPCIDYVHRENIGLLKFGVGFRF